MLNTILSAVRVGLLAITSSLSDKAEPRYIDCDHPQCGGIMSLEAKTEMGRQYVCADTQHHQRFVKMGEQVDPFSLVRDRDKPIRTYARSRNPAPLS